jgi:hypothetical protein
MTLTLNLTPELEQYLTDKAEQQGLSVEVFILQFLTEKILKQEKQTSLIKLLDSWLDEGDALEQKETGEFLIGALDEDRLSKRKLFPSSMKGVSW